MPDRRCPICKAPMDKAYRPFCSKRCADVDLGRWMSGAYVAPGAEPADEEALATALRDAAPKD